MSKDIKPKEKQNRDPKQLKFDPNEFFQNTLSLPDALKEQITAKGLDWRFINAVQFRSSGGYHHAHWRPYKVEGEAQDVGLYTLSPERYVQRGDLILAVRDKAVTKAHKEHLARRNQQYQAFNKEKAKELRKVFKDAGMAESAVVHEGYEDPTENK